MAQLSLHYDHATWDRSAESWADFGTLSLRVETDDFTGKGRYSCVRWQEVTAFAERLLTFPITESAPIVVQWGRGSQVGDDLMLRIEIAPTDRRGGLVVRCEMADEHDDGDRGARLRAWFWTSYAELDIFRTSILLVMNGEADAALLTGR